jgi:hypothetical protein
LRGRTGMSAKTEIAPEPIAQGGRRIEETAAEPPPGQAAQTVTANERAALYARVFRATELQMDHIEAELRKVGSWPEAQSDRKLRTFALLNKALREIVEITRPDEAAFPDEADDDPVPGDIDEFRNELARRIHALLDARERRRGAGGADRTDTGADGGAA